MTEIFDQVDVIITASNPDVAFDAQGPLPDTFGGVVAGAGNNGVLTFPANIFGNPFDTSIAVAHLVFGGVMDRFPRLNVVLPHAGGAVPFLWGRMQHGQAIRAEFKDKTQRPFGEYLPRFYYDTITHDPKLLRFLIDEVGIDHVMLGSDYCFDMGYERPREVIDALRLRPAEKDKIYASNAARLLRM